MANVLDQAQNIRGVVAAARFRDRMARREANATDPAERRAAREAIFDVEERFHDLADVPVGGAERFARERGHGRGSRSPVHEGRHRAAPGSSMKRGEPAAKGPKKRQASAKAAAPKRRRRRRGRGAPKPTPRVDRAIRRTGVPATVDTGGSLVMSAIGVTIGMGLAYLVLISAEKSGSGATRVRHLLESVAPNAIGRFLSPYEDVFSGGEPVYQEGPGSNVATAAARLRAAEQAPHAARRATRHTRQPTKGKR